VREQPALASSRHDALIVGGLVGGGQAQAVEQGAAGEEAGGVVLASCVGLWLDRTQTRRAPRSRANSRARRMALALAAMPEWSGMGRRASWEAAAITVSRTGSYVTSLTSTASKWPRPTVRSRVRTMARASSAGPWT
jgi:hypothetical protein